MIKCPKGFKFLVKRSIASKHVNVLPQDLTRYIHIYAINIKTKEKVGYVDLVWSDHRCKFWETHSFFNEEVRGIGLGVAAYAKAIDVALKRKEIVASSSAPSEDAKRVWMSKRLNAVYNIEYRLIKRSRHVNSPLQMRYIVNGRKKKSNRQVQSRQ